MLCTKGQGPANAAGFLEGLRLHEGRGSNPAADEPDGYQARYEKNAGEFLVGDPHWAMELFVDKEASDLHDLSDAAVLGVDRTIQTYASNEAHQHVKGNWCGSVFIYEASSNEFVKVRFPQDLRCP